ncbi:hypothetical protein [Agromyces aerolatus]|uniref:hypothetical protein n=1 Tax=Agromyces sp. LY-1074 TaxID=3074080 RepID=UPI00286415A3|nr:MULTISPECIES: hypothetical protein [unclassified Agromyces]MDR5700371.1 hypothetical protein [Agromyces sp. LY-1074]MDR5706651.1 hypothetical protein [Agromyces sp. LY-1358]
MPASVWRRIRARLRPLRARATAASSRATDLVKRVAGRVAKRVASARGGLRILVRPRGADERDVRSLMLRHAFSRSTLLGDQPRVSLTSYGWRLDTVHLAIESIGRGSARPRTLTLWLEAPPTGRIRRRLRRLERRGLRVRLTEGYGPHTKYYPEIRLPGGTESPLVTADDDMVYPPDWLRQLDSAARDEPELIHCHRAHRVLATDDAIAPYTEWTPVADRTPRLGNLATGVSGVIYPPRVLRALAARGTDFRDASPTADDIWIHATAVEEGIATRQLSRSARLFPAVPGTQVYGLYAHNVVGGANDAQVAASYSAAAVAQLAAESEAERDA